MAKKKVALTKEDKFHSCPKCFGPIDYFNTCRQCGRPWTPTLTKAEIQEMEAAERGEESEDPEPVLVGERESALEREKEEIIGKVAKPVGTKKKNASPQFKHWEIDDGDDDTEIIRKRSLMHLDTRKVYNQMGLAMRAYQTQKKVLICLSNLWGFLDEPERNAFAPTAEMLKQGLIGLAELSSKKVNLAAEMEEALVREKRKARTVRSAKSVINAAIKKATKVTTPGHDSEGFETVDLKDIDPEELMEQVKIQLAQRTNKFKKDAEEEEN
jgi:hypothetical protein